MSLPVYVGWDSREDIAYQVCEHSIYSHSSQAEVKPLNQEQLRKDKWYWRELDKLASTEFTFTRFLIPALENYKGWALFCDSDIIFTRDVKELFDCADDKYAVMCVKHDYTPKSKVKFLNQVQTVYPKKNWSSFMLMNCKKCTTLTPDYVNKASGLELHQFKWLESEDLIGDLPLEWNWLAGEYEYKDDIKL